MRKIFRSGLLAITVAAVLATSAAHAQLVGFYGLDGDVSDSSGRANHASLIGSPAALGGAGFNSSGAFTGDGTSQRGVITPLNISPGLSKQVIIGGWVNLNNASTYQTFLQADGLFGRKLGVDDRNTSGTTTPTWSYAAHGGRSIGISEDDWHVGNTNPLKGDTKYGWRAVLAGQPATTGDWVFVAATYDQARGETTVYSGTPSGSLQSAKYVDSYPFVSTGRNTLHIGSINTQFELLNGRIDNVFVFDGALTAQQLNTLKAAANPLAAAQQLGNQVSANKNRTWKVDFQPDTGIGAAGIDSKETWNEVVAFDLANGLEYQDMADTAGNTTSAPTFQLNGNVRAFSYSAAGDPAAGDYIYWGGVNGTSSSLTFELKNLNPNKLYSFSPIGGGVVDSFDLNNERRRFAMRLDANGDGFRDTTRLVKMGRGAQMDFIAKPDANGTISGIAGPGGDSGSEANWGGFILEELGAPSDNKFKLAQGPIHRYSFDGSGTNVLQDTGTIGGAHGEVLALFGSDQLDGSGKLRLNDAQGQAYGAQLPNQILNGLSSVSVEAWIDYTDANSTDGLMPTNTPLFSFGNPNGEVFQQFAKGTRITQYSYWHDSYHNVQLRATEGNRPAELVAGDDLWIQGQTYHAVVTLEAGIGVGGLNVLSYYINGMLVKQALSDVDLSEIDFQQMLLGTNQEFNKSAIIDFEEFRIYGYALSQDEIIGNYFSGPNLINLVPEPASQVVWMCLVFGWGVANRRRRGQADRLVPRGLVN